MNSIPAASKERKVRLLITGAGAPGPLEMLRSLAQTERYELIGADANAFSPGFPRVARHYVIPMGAATEFPEAMRKLLAHERPDFIVPNVDEEIPIVHELVAKYFPETRVITPQPEFCVLAMDKWEMAEAMAREGLATARTWLADNASACTYPAIIKPRTGRGSRGLAFLESPADLAAYLQASPESPQRFIVQERLRGAEYTTSAIVSLAGELLAVVPKEVIEKRGITRIGVTRSVPAIDALCAAIQTKLRANGPFNVQLILGEDGVPWVFEINPRYSTTTALTIASGIDEVDVVIRRALGEALPPLSFRAGLMMIRHETQTFVEESEWKPPFAAAL